MHYTYTLGSVTAVVEEFGSEEWLNVHLERSCRQVELKGGENLRMKDPQHPESAATHLHLCTPPGKESRVCRGLGINIVV